MNNDYKVIIRLQAFLWIKVFIEIFSKDVIMRANGYDISDGEIYSGAELTSWNFQWDLTL